MNKLIAGIATGAAGLGLALSVGACSGHSQPVHHRAVQAPVTQQAPATTAPAAPAAPAPAIPTEQYSAGQITSIIENPTYWVPEDGTSVSSVTVNTIHQGASEETAQVQVTYSDGTVWAQTWSLTNGASPSQYGMTTGTQLSAGCPPPPPNSLIPSGC
jgi:hypothetical protein